MKRIDIILIAAIIVAFFLTNPVLADPINDYKALLVELRLDRVSLAKFNLFFGLNLQLSSELNGQEILMFIQIVTEKDYNREVFLRALDKTADLLISLKEDSSLLSAFNSLFSTNILSVGTLMPQDAKTLFDLTGDPNFDTKAFLVALPKVNNLYKTLKTNQETSATFNELFATQISPQGDLTKKDRATLFSVAATPSFDQEVFIAALPKAKNLVEVIKTDKKATEEFNNIFDTEISGFTPLAAQDRGVIFDVSGDPKFNQEDFLKVLPKADSLLETVTSDSVALESFNNIFDTAISSQGEVPASERGILFDVAGSPGFNQQDFIETLPKMQSLNETIRENTELSQGFNELFDTKISSSENLTSKDKGTLFDVAGSPGFNENNFVAVLPKTQSLLETLKNDKETAENFNNLFNTNVEPDKDLVPQDRGILFDVAGDPAFNQGSFLEALPKTNELSQTLKADKEAATTFDNLFNTSVGSSGEINAKDRGVIFDVSGDPKFNQANFLAALPGAENLYKSIVANNGIANDFNQVFGTNISVSGVLAPRDRGTLFDVSAAPGFNQDKFLEVLSKTANLLTLLRANPQSVINNFNSQFNADITESEPLSDASKKALFDIAGGPYYNASIFLQSLGGTTSATANEKKNFTFVPNLAGDSETDRLFAPLSP